MSVINTEKCVLSLIILPKLKVNIDKMAPVHT